MYGFTSTRCAILLWAATHHEHHAMHSPRARKQLDRKGLREAPTRQRKDMYRKSSQEPSAPRHPPSRLVSRPACHERKKSSRPVPKERRTGHWRTGAFRKGSWPQVLELMFLVYQIISKYRTLVAYCICAVDSCQVWFEGMHFHACSCPKPDIEI